ncbi:MAG: N utilization substance protein B [Verrucomicrobia subdivision 3 bacterium]|nr:N utilization substance protein B [Limisphaerales bacterium]MCS1413728.1 N utilization substance protein B [Limisphaerales bacterium]
MRPRREAREKAIQFLFQFDLNPTSKLDEALDRFWGSQRNAKADKPAPPDEQTDEGATAEKSAVRLFGDPLIKGVIEHLKEIDQTIKQHAKNWDINRMAVVDRNVLRLAIYEMHHRDDIPPVVSINEAVDISKRFSTEDSGRFVNGILDRVKQDLMRPARTPVPKSA